jgi:hypothetical protein
LFLQALVPQAKSVSFPVQYFDFVAAAVDEHKQHASKGLRFSCCSTSSDNPSIDFLKSTGATHK